MFDDEMLTIDEVAQYLKLRPQTIYRWAQTGKIPGAKFGKEWRFRRSSIEQWIDQQISSTTREAEEKQKEKQRQKQKKGESRSGASKAGADPGGSPQSDSPKRGAEAKESRGRKTAKEGRDTPRVPPTDTGPARN